VIVVPSEAVEVSGSIGISSIGTSQAARYGTSTAGARVTVGSQMSAPGRAPRVVALGPALQGMGAIVERVRDREAVMVAVVLFGVAGVYSAT
jgi:hypothetical protein